MARQLVYLSMSKNCIDMQMRYGGEGDTCPGEMGNSLAILALIQISCIAAMISWKILKTSSKKLSFKE